MKHYSHIPFDYKLFINVFISLNIVFSFYTINFFIGNHDWDWVKGTTQILELNTGLFEGRFSKFILNILLFSGHILPILNNIFSFLFASLGMVLIVDYLKIKDKTIRFIIALTPLLSSYILSWLYFSINILGNFFAIFLIGYSLILLEKDKISAKILSVISIIFALGIYPSVVETIFILYATKNILTPNTNIKKQLSPLIYIFLSIILFRVIIIFLEHFDLIYKDHYNMKTNTLSNMFLNLFNYLSIFIKQFYITLPFFPKLIKIIGLIAVILAFITTLTPIKNIIFWIISFGATILSVILTFLPEEVAFQPRINFYGLNFLYMSSFAILLNQKQSIKNLTYVLAIIYLYISINQNFYAQKIWELGKTAEINHAMRVTNRIEDKLSRSPQILILTDTISLRPKFYSEIFAKKAPYILETSFTIRHIPSGIYNFYAPSDIFYKNSQISDISKELEHYLTTLSSYWPKEESIYIDNTYVIVIMTKQGLQAIKAQLPK